MRRTGGEHELRRPEKNVSRKQGNSMVVIATTPRIWHSLDLWLPGGGSPPFVDRNVYKRICIPVVSYLRSRKRRGDRAVEGARLEIVNRKILALFQAPQHQCLHYISSDVEMGRWNIFLEALWVRSRLFQNFIAFYVFTVCQPVLEGVHVAWRSLLPFNPAISFLSHVSRFIFP